MAERGGVRYERIGYAGPEDEDDKDTLLTPNNSGPPTALTWGSEQDLERLPALSTQEGMSRRPTLYEDTVPLDYAALLGQDREQGPGSAAVPAVDERHASGAAANATGHGKAGGTTREAARDRGGVGPSGLLDRASGWFSGLSSLFLGAGGGSESVGERGDPSSAHGSGGSAARKTAAASGNASARRSPSTRLHRSDSAASAEDRYGPERRAGTLRNLPQSLVSMITSPLQRPSSTVQNRRDLLMEYNTAETTTSGEHVVMRVRERPSRTNAGDEGGVAANDKTDNECIEFLVKNLDTGEERYLTEKEVIQLTSSNTVAGFRRRRLSLSGIDGAGGASAAAGAAFSPGALLSLASGRGLRRGDARGGSGAATTTTTTTTRGRSLSLRSTKDSKAEAHPFPWTTSATAAAAAPCSSAEQGASQATVTTTTTTTMATESRGSASQASDSSAPTASAASSAATAATSPPPRSSFAVLRLPSQKASLPKREHQRLLREFRSAQGFVRVLSPSKSQADRVFDNLCRVQELRFHRGPIWSLEFSKDGRYLASGGQDGLVVVWDVQNDDSSCAAPAAEITELARRLRSAETAGGGLIDPYVYPSAGGATGAPSSDNSTAGSGDGVRGGGGSGRQRRVRQVYRREVIRAGAPHRVFEGHKGDVLCIAWSSNNFLLSSSMDKTVRLWHVDYGQVLRKFLHADFVTSVAFHPKNENFFLSGSLDERIRLWNISMRHVSDYAEVRGLITACAFTPDGEQALVGTYKGACKVYNVVRYEEGERALQYITTLDVRSRRGKNSHGSKVTSFAMMPAVERIGSVRALAAGDTDQQYEVLISTNDSRLRLYRVQDLKIVSKFAGHACTWNHIRAGFSDDYRYVITASEDRQVYVWETVLYDDAASPALKKGSGGQTQTAAAAGATIPHIRRYRNEAYESFTPHRDARVTAAVFAPRATTLRPGLSSVRLARRPAQGRVVITSSHDGQMCVYENVPSYLVPA